MPIIKIDTGRSSTKVGRYLAIDRTGAERSEYFASNTAAENVKEAELQFRATREAHEKTEGRQFFQAYISFQRNDLGSLANPDGTPNWERIGNYGKEWAERFGIAQRHEFYVVAHGDKPHPHIHVVWNAVAYEDGLKFRFHGKPDMERARDVNDQLAREHGIQRQLDRHREPDRAPDAVIRAAQRGADSYSWKMDLQNRIKSAASYPTSEQSYMVALKREGIEVRTRGGHYTYSFEDATGMKRVARASRLGEPYQRASLLDRFSSHQQRMSSHDQMAQVRMMKGEQTHFRSWQSELRGKIQEAKRRTTSFVQFEARLAQRGVRVSLDNDGNYRYSFTDTAGAKHDHEGASSLGPPYDKEALRASFDENAIRRAAAAQIAAAARQVTNETDFSRALAEHGITLSAHGGRYRYSLETPTGQRTFEGEALSRHVATDAVKLRYAENADLRAVHQRVASARSLAGSPEEYLSRLQARAIELHHDDLGKAYLRYEGASHDAKQFMRTDLDRETFSAGASAVKALARAAEGIALEYSREIATASTADYYDAPEPSRTRERRRSLRPPMDTEIPNEEL